MGRPAVCDRALCLFGGVSGSGPGARLGTSRSPISECDLRAVALGLLALALSLLVACYFFIFFGLRLAGDGGDAGGPQ